MIKTNDRDVRAALLTKVIAEHVANPDTLVVEELGLDRGSCRVDVAVVNGHLHGYEIKSDRDTLTRLPSQVSSYSKVLDRASLVVGERHLDAAILRLPDWWGVRVVSVGSRGAVNIRLVRASTLNPTVCLESVAKLLWRDELIALLAEHGVDNKALRTSRAELCRLAKGTVPTNVLRARVRACLKSRTTWRHPARP